MWLLTLRSILAATDLEDGSTAALETAARLASLSEARLHLLHVLGDSSGTRDDRLEAAFRIAAPEAADPLTADSIAGIPSAVIVEHAARVNADALILGRHRSSGASGELGSTAASVVRDASCPCLVAATPLRLPLERVLVPIDLSDTATGALSVAVSWASALRHPGRHARITALHVTSDGSRPEAEEVVREVVRRARAHAGAAASVDIEEMVVSDADPAEEILRQAEATSADLVVIGTSGRSRKGGDLGSVSAAVARTTNCPLLLVPPGIWEDRATRQS